MPQPRGTLYLVVGPSGAGKDSLIDGTKAALGSDERYVFARRYITRPANAGGENHIPLENDEFSAMVERGDLLLHWHAHNLRYGIPASVDEHLAQGRNVVLNVSRTVVDDARATLAPVRILYITVSDEILAERLRNRGRESHADIAKRVERAREHPITGSDVFMIDNGGELNRSISIFLQAIGATNAPQANENS